MRLVVAAFLVVALPCQANPDRVLVLVQRPSAPTAAMHEVDVASGITVPLPGFPSDNLLPLAIAIDPATREPALALAFGASSRLVRVHVRGSQVVGETVLATVPGTVVGMMYPSVGDLFVATEDPIGGQSGLWRVPRHGGAGALVWSASGISALSDPVILPGKYWTARDQTPALPVLDAFLDANPGAVAAGPYAVQWLPNTRLTGVHEFWHGGRVQMFSDTLGRVHTVRFPNWAATWQLVPLQPTIQPGGARRLKGGPDGRVLVLGGSVDPTLKSFPQTTPLAVVPVTVVGGPFLGDPVDFAVVASSDARSVRFGAPCLAPAGSTAIALGTPELGSATFAVQQQNGLPNTWTLFVAGWSERSFFGAPLPLLLGTCHLLVSAETVLVQFTDGVGTATHPLPIPLAPALAGQIAYVQWWQELQAPRSSNALALHLF